MKVPAIVWALIPVFIALIVVLIMFLDLPNQPDAGTIEDLRLWGVPVILFGFMGAAVATTLAIKEVN